MIKENEMGAWLKEAADWLKEAAERNIPKIDECEVFTALLNEKYMSDPLCALQLGYALLLDKPIILIVDQNMTVPHALVRVAKLIERVDMNDPKGMAKASQAISEFMSKFPERT